MLQHPQVFPGGPHPKSWQHPIVLPCDPQAQNQSATHELPGRCNMQDILIEQSNTHFDSIMNFRKETVEKEAHHLVQQVLEKHKGVEAIKVTEHFLEDHHNQQAVDLGEAMFHER